MNSIQANLLKLYYRFQRMISPPPIEPDVKKERAEFEEIAKLFRPLAGLKITQLDVDGISAEWIEPPVVAGGQTILYLHGGYYLIGSIASHRNLAGNIGIAAKAHALIIDYGLAPEHPFPAGLEDAIKAYSWLLSTGTQAHQIYLVGDSAGGGLVLATLLALRDRSIPLPAAAICLSPVTDITLSGESWNTNLKKEFVVNYGLAKLAQSLYLREIDPHNPLASPLFADLHGLPPLLIQVGSEEALLSDSTEFAEKARAAGISVILEVWPGMFHVWQYTASLIPEARKAINRIGEFIQSVN